MIVVPFFTILCRLIALGRNRGTDFPLQLVDNGRLRVIRKGGVGQELDTMQGGRLFITFEGIEGCGKTTQMRRLKDRLRSYGVSFVSTLEPGGTEIGKKVRQILLDSGNRNLTPLAELLLYSADRAQHVEEVIRPALDQGKWVICDRYFDATVAYQGSARNQDIGLIQFLNGKVTGGISPDITFLLDCPVEVGLRRALKRNEEQESEGQDRFEKENIDFHQEVRRAYLGLAKEYPERFAVIDATMDVEDVEKKIFERIKPFLDLKASR